MNQSESRLRLIAKEILLDLLRKGEAPTGEKLALLLKLRTQGLDTSKSEISQKENQFEWGEVSSAKKMNDITRTIASDIFVLYQSYLQNEQRYVQLLDKTLNEMEQLNRRAQALIARANRMLIVEDRVEGLLEIFTDNFANGSLINLEETDARVDLEGQSVYLPYNTERPTSFNEFLDIRRIAQTDIQVSLLNGTTRRAPGTRDSSTLDMLSNSSRPWVFTVSDSTRGPVSIEVKIDLRQGIIPQGGLLTAKKIMIDPFIIGSSILLAGQYSEDGISWFDFPVVDPSRRIATPTVFLLEEMTFRFIRFILTKDSHDRLDQVGRYTYDFGIRSISFESVLSEYAREAVFESVVLTSKKEDGTLNDIRSAVLSLACEHIETDTSIDYELVFVDGDLNESGPKKVIPLNRQDGVGSRIAEYSSVTLNSFSATISQSTESYIGSDSIRNRILEGSVSNGLLQVWRNRGRNDRYYLVKDKEGVFREDGWIFKEGNYHTYIWVEENGGQEMDFGPYQITIDNTVLTGRVRLSEGLHHCIVQESRWYSLEGLSNVSTFDRLTGEFVGNKVIYGSTIGLDDEPERVEGARVVDPLYPYNHKLILEGLNYSSLFLDTATKQRYKGALFAAHFPYFISENEFVSRVNDKDYDSYSKVSVSDGSGGVDTRIMVKWFADNEEPREEFLVIEKSNGEAKGIKLIARLRTRDPKRSPSFDGYQIRIIN